MAGFVSEQSRKHYGVVETGLGPGIEKSGTQLWLCAYWLYDLVNPEHPISKSIKLGR